MSLDYHMHYFLPVFYCARYESWETPNAYFIKWKNSWHNQDMSLSLKSHPSLHSYNLHRRGLSSKWQCSIPPALSGPGSILDLSPMLWERDGGQVRGHKQGQLEGEAALSRQLTLYHSVYLPGDSFLSATYTCEAEEVGVKMHRWRGRVKFLELMVQSPKPRLHHCSWGPQLRNASFPQVMIMFTEHGGRLAILWVPPTDHIAGNWSHDWGPWVSIISWSQGPQGYRILRGSSPSELCSICI